MVMQARFYVPSSNYRYGFNNQENDDDVKGESNDLDFKYRAEDPRVGRFLSIDPLVKKYPGISPYSFARNMVIRYKEMEGAEIGDPFNTAYWAAVLSASLSSTINEGVGATARLATGQSGELPKEAKEGENNVGKSLAKLSGVASDVGKSVKALTIPYKVTNAAASFVIPEAGAVNAMGDFYNGDYISGTLGMAAYGVGGYFRAGEEINSINSINVPYAIGTSNSLETTGNIIASTAERDLAIQSTKARVFEAGGEIGMLDGTANLTVNSKSGFFNLTVNTGSETGVITGEINIKNNIIGFENLEITNAKGGLGSKDLQNSIGFSTFNKIQKELTELIKAGGYDNGYIEFSRLRPVGSKLPDSETRKINLLNK